ncbi:unnamed protein product [Phaedon cochleariae]|uniref:FP protein C-terminal domain-containing protein n=1 Tax=Phaedon cochleariae TaxID=80249 RepID=A0A9N9SJW5_PHACE|nr:unnamed protein product [Phaedon cochleariae]
MGIPEVSSNENVEGTIKEIGKKLDIHIGNFKSFRLGRSEIGKIMPIKVEFDSEQDKMSMLKAIKSKRITTQDIGIVGQGYDIYINQDLTEWNLQVYKATKTYAKENNYKFVWVQNGQILLRKSEEDKVHVIEKEEDLHSLKNF